VLTLVVAAPSADRPLAAIQEGGDNPVWLSAVVLGMILIVVVGLVRRRK
jgi:hypothetical protein